MEEIGYVISAQDYLVFVEGLPSARVNDIIVTKKGGRALVSALDNHRIEALMLDSDRPLPGDSFSPSTEGLRLPISSNLFGRAINPIGLPIDGKPALPPATDPIDLEIVAPGIETREIITKQFYTGLTAIDTLVPIAQGQRELILGEARAGEPSFYLDVILAQKLYNRICVYCAIGRPELEVRRFAEAVNANGASDYTIIIAATSNESAPMISIAPAVALSVAEYYCHQSKDVLCILDDLGTHARYIREMTLLAGRIPGRESYPADIFYQHSHLLERGGNFNALHKGGSITMLPVIETALESFSNLIPTNIMSITDGHIMFSSSLYATGTYPAVQVDKSVTRVGRQTQIFIHKVLSDKVRSLMANYREMERYASFGSELTPETMKTIKRGKVLEELLKQAPLSPIPWEVQIVYLALVFTGVFDEIQMDILMSKKKALIELIKTDNAFTKYFDRYKTMKFDAFITELVVDIGLLKKLLEAA